MKTQHPALAFLALHINWLYIFGDILVTIVPRSIHTASWNVHSSIGSFFYKKIKIFLY